VATLQPRFFGGIPQAKLEQFQAYSRTRMAKPNSIVVVKSARAPHRPARNFCVSVFQAGTVLPAKRNGANVSLRKCLKLLRLDFPETDCGLEAFHLNEGSVLEVWLVRDQLEPFGSWDAVSDTYGRVIDLAGKVVKPLGYGWLAAAALTWMLCPSPAPLPLSLSAGVRYADEAGYFIECLSLWPAIAYFTLMPPSK
jgi:hypothetical protein